MSIKTRTEMAHRLRLLHKLLRSSKHDGERAQLERMLKLLRTASQANKLRKREKGGMAAII